MEKTILDQQMTILRWFSAVELQVAQENAKRVSEFLREFKGLKSRQGEMWCRLKPCQRSQYARGICAYHYRFFQWLLKSVPASSWGELATLGLVDLTANELREKSKKERCNAACNQNDPLHALIKKVSPLK